MSIILSIIIYLLLFILAVFIAAIIIPTRYSFKGGYNNNLYCFANMDILYFCKVSASYNTQDSFAKLNIWGFTINIDPDTFIKKDKKEAPKKINKEKSSNKSSMDSQVLKQLLQKDLILHTLRFLKDMVGILRPRVLMVKGKIGFYEPHHTAWFQAVSSTISELNIFTNLDIDTVWDYEYFEGELKIEGQITPIVILFRLLKFIISKHTLKAIKIIITARKKKKMLKPAT